MGQFMHHNHDHTPKIHPSSTPRLQYQLYDFTGVEVPPDELGIGLVFLQRHDGKMVGFEDRVAYRSDAGEEVFSKGGGGSREGFDEDDMRGGMLVAGIETLDADRHLDR
jgi:hypothetical protein